MGLNYRKGDTHTLPVPEIDLLGNQRELPPTIGCVE